MIPNAGPGTPSFASYAALVQSGHKSSAIVDGVALGADKNGPYAHGVNSGKILLIGDSLLANFTLHGKNLTGTSLSGVSKQSARGENGVGTLKFYISDRSLTWTPPSGEEGPRTIIAYPKSVKVYGADGVSYIYVGVRPSEFPASDASASLTVAYQSTTFFGSTSVYGAQQASFPAMLKALSRGGLNAITYAVGGLATDTLLDLILGLINDPSEVENLRGVERILLGVGTNDMFGYGEPDPSLWQENIAQAIRLLRIIAPVTVMIPPMCGLGNTTLQQNAWRYMWKPLPQTCIDNGAKCINIHSSTFTSTINLPDAGMIPDQAHQSSPAMWYIGAELLSEFPGHRGAYLGNTADNYDPVLNPTGNLLGFIIPIGTGGTAGAGGTATALLPGWNVSRITGSSATITATQKRLDNVSALWQSLTMAGATAITEVCKAFGDYSFTAPDAGSILDGRIALRIPRQEGLRRIGVRMSALGASGEIVAWDNDRNTSVYPAIPDEDFDLDVPLEGFVVPSGMTGIRVEIYMQTEIGATATVFFRDMALRPRA